MVALKSFLLFAIPLSCILLLSLLLLWWQNRRLKKMVSEQRHRFETEISALRMNRGDLFFFETPPSSGVSEGTGEKHPNHQEKSQHVQVIEEELESLKSSMVSLNQQLNFLTFVLRHFPLPFLA